MPNYNGKTGSTAWADYLEQSGFNQTLRDRGEEQILPVHKFELLRDALEERYQRKLSAYLSERKNNGFTDTPADIARYRSIWIDDILTMNVEEWLNPTGVMAIRLKQEPSDKIELEKYKLYLLNQINESEGIIRDSQQGVESSNDPLNLDPTPNQTPTPDELQPKLTIFPPMQTRLFKTLSQFVPTDQHGSLELLLDKGFSSKRVWVKLPAGTIGYIFKQAITATADKILAGNEVVALWLAAYLDWGKNTPKPISAVTIEKIFRGNTLVSKTNQTPLKQ